MERSAIPRHDRYDVVVVGSGLGGVSAAALLAKHGRRVLLVERGDGPGGYAHAFRRGPYVFDAAIHVIPEGEFVYGLLDYLGVRSEVTLMPCATLYAAEFPGLHAHIPMGREAFIESHIRQFPHEAAGFRQFFEVLTRVFIEGANVPMQTSIVDVDEMARRFPTLFKYRMATVQEVLDEYLSDARLKALCAASWSYMGLPPSRLSFLHFAQLLNVIIDGSWYCQGSFQKLADAFVTALERNAGELIVNNGVSKILIEEGKACGVRLADGSEIRATHVISNADARHTFLDLVGEEHFPPMFLKRLNRMVPSVSAFLVFAGTTMDMERIGAAHENFLFRHWDQDQVYRDVEEGRPGGLSANIPTLADPSLAPAGEHAVVMRALAPYDIGRSWKEEKQRYTDAVLADVEEAFPGFRDSLTFVESATPLVLERYTNNYHGACYGWEISPRQVGSQRLNHETPVPNLYLSGHWTQEGAGSFRTMVSGIHTAQIVLKYEGERVEIPSFKREALLLPA